MNIESDKQAIIISVYVYVLMFGLLWNLGKRDLQGNTRIQFYGKQYISEITYQNPSQQPNTG